MTCGQVIYLLCKLKIFTFMYFAFPKKALTVIHNYRFIHMLSCMCAAENWDGSHKCKVHTLFIQFCHMNHVLYFLSQS